MLADITEFLLTFGVLVFACLTWLVLLRLVGLTCTCLLTIEPAGCDEAGGGGGGG